MFPRLTLRSQAIKIIKESPNLAVLPVGQDTLPYTVKMRKLYGTPRFSECN